MLYFAYHTPSNQLSQYSVCIPLPCFALPALWMRPFRQKCLLFFSTYKSKKMSESTLEAQVEALWRLTNQAKHFLTQAKKHLMAAKQSQRFQGKITGGPTAASALVGKTSRLYAGQLMLVLSCLLPNSKFIIYCDYCTFKQQISWLEIWKGLSPEARSGCSKKPTG